jgi:predicted negative regulator of RcsB-dependent stress response
MFLLIFILFSISAWQCQIYICTSTDAEQYKATVAEVRGDVLLASAQPEKAREAYAAALQASKNGANPVLQMKLDDLSVASDKVDAPKAK